MVQRALIPAVIAFSLIACGDIVGAHFGEYGPDPCLSASEFHVHTGDADCAYDTIAQAVAAARASSAPTRTVHVGAGTFSADTGETFPLTLHDGVSLVGAGAGTTTILGGGAALGTELPAAIVVGDSQRPTSVSGISFVPDPAAHHRAVAIVCDRGAVGAVGEASVSTARNTTVSGVSITGFEEGILALAASSGGGCGMNVLASTLAGGSYGVYVDAARAPVSLAIGDGTPQGASTFRGYSVSDAGHLAEPWNAAAVYVTGLGADVVVSGNQFTNDDFGVVADATIGVTTFAAIDGNDFETLHNSGVYLKGPAVVRELAGNRFTGITTRPAIVTWGGIGLILESPDAATPYPTIARVRNNTFFANDVGVAVRGSGKMLQASDFGTAGDPGGNTFACNSFVPYTQQMNVIGVDVLLTSAGDATKLPFVGNAWDHAPPAARAGDPNELDAAVGTDLYEWNLSADVRNASTAKTLCPPTRTAGPTSE